MHLHSTQKMEYKETSRVNVCFFLFLSRVHVYADSLFTLLVLSSLGRPRGQLGFYPFGNKNVYFVDLLRLPLLVF